MKYVWNMCFLIVGFVLGLTLVFVVPQHIIDGVRDAFMWYRSGDFLPMTAKKKYDQTVALSSLTLTIEDDGIVIPHQYLAFYHKLRRQDVLRVALIREMMEQGYVNFVRKPRGENPSPIWLSESGDDRVWSGMHLDPDDHLDRYLARKIEVGRDIHIPFADLLSLEYVYLFRNEYDLRALGYQVISRRERVARDTSVRVKNIATAFREFGYVRIINATGSLSFFGNIGYDPLVRQRYAMGNGIIGSDIVSVYAGGICGASTALMQAFLTNRAIAFLEQRNHTKRFHKLYDASIDGQMVTTPGLDASVYEGLIDFRIQNTSSYPLISVIHYYPHASGGMVESLFTLAREDHRGSIVFQRTFRDPVSNLACYEWLRNGDQKLVSCYKAVNP